MRYLVYDLEIRKGILGRQDIPEAGIDYCQGWGDHANMGISCLCAYDSGEDRYRVFFDDNRGCFEELVKKADLLVGFNNIRFDDKVLAACGWPVGHGVPRYDILREIAAAKGLNPNGIHGGHSLEACSTANGGSPKSGHGAQAPIDWQRGRTGSLVDYCLEDVRLTRQLFERIRDIGGLIDPIDRDRFVRISSSWPGEVR